MERTDLFGLAALPLMNLSALIDAVLDEALGLSGADLGGAVYLCDPENEWNRFRLRPAQGSPRASREQLAEECERSYRGSRLEEKGERPAFFEGSAVVQRLPLFEHEPFVGVLQLESSRRMDASGAKGPLRELARQAGVVIARQMLREHAAERGWDIHLIGSSPKLLEMERQIKRVAADPRRPVLIEGERGSGKELVAYAVHFFSSRRHKPFLPINSAAFSDTLLSDELFGHEKHSFTGAQTNREGVFKAAEGGTLFFDEIGDMPGTVQASLLRVLDQGEFHRIGRDRPLKVDVRVVGATNRDLYRLVAERAFRADLFDRLNVFPIEVPPLRERKVDIPLLATCFLRQSCLENGRRTRVQHLDTCHVCRRTDVAGCVAPQLYSRLAEYDYPGNVRELRNLLSRLAALVSNQEIRAEDAAPYLTGRPASLAGPRTDLRLDSVVREHILEVLRLSGNNKTKAARALGLPLTTLVNKMNKLGLR